MGVEGRMLAEDVRRSGREFLPIRSMEGLRCSLFDEAIAVDLCEESPMWRYCRLVAAACWLRPGNGVCGEAPQQLFIRRQVIGDSLPYGKLW